MYVDNLSEEDLAKVFTDFVFCNTPVADYYGETATMDDVFYATMLDVVAVNLRRIARNHKLLAQPEAEVDAAVEAMYPSRAMEFMRYATAFADYEARLPGADWAAPTCITVEPPKDRAAFLLDGAFREGCERQWRLDDETMRRIEQDVYDRTFTLLRLGLLPRPSHVR